MKKLIIGLCIAIFLIGAISIACNPGNYGNYEDCDVSEHSGRYKDNGTPNYYADDEIYFFEKTSSDAYGDLGVFSDEFWTSFLSKKYKTNIEIVNTYIGDIGNFQDDFWTEYLQHHYTDDSMSYIRTSYDQLWWCYYKSANSGKDKIRLTDEELKNNIGNIMTHANNLLYALSAYKNDTNIKEYYDRLEEIQGYSNTDNYIMTKLIEENYKGVAEWYTKMHDFYTNNEKYNQLTEEKKEEILRIVNNLLYEMKQAKNIDNKMEEYCGRLENIYNGLNEKVSEGKALINGRDIYIDEGKSRPTDDAHNSYDYYNYLEQRVGGMTKGERPIASFYIKIKRNGEYLKSATNEDIRINCSSELSNEGNGNKVKYNEDKPIGNENVLLLPGDELEFYDCSQNAGVEYDDINYDFQSTVDHTSGRLSWDNIFTKTDELNQNKYFARWMVDNEDLGQYFIFYLSIKPTTNKYLGYGSINGNHAVVSGPKKGITNSNWITYFASLKLQVISPSNLSIHFVEEKTGDNGEEYLEDIVDARWIESMRFVDGDKIYLDMNIEDSKNWLVKVNDKDIGLTSDEKSKLSAYNVDKIYYRNGEYDNLEPIQSKREGLEGSKTIDYDETVVSDNKTHIYICLKDKKQESNIYVYHIKKGGGREIPETYIKERIVLEKDKGGYTFESNMDGYKLVSTYINYGNSYDKKHISNENGINNTGDAIGKGLLKSRNPGRGTEDIHIIAEYQDNNMEEKVPVYLYYIQEGEKFRTTEKSFNMWLLGMYSSGEIIQKELDVQWVFSGEKYELQKSYICSNESNTPDFVSSKNLSEGLGKFVTKRNIIIGHEDRIYIVAEYRKSPEIEEKTVRITDLNPEAIGAIRSDDYNVYQGIPTHKTVYGNVLNAKNYLIDLVAKENIGEKEYMVNISKTYKWNYYEPNCKCACTGHSHTDPITGITITTKGGSECTCGCSGTHLNSTTVTKSYNVTREYSYWTIQNLNIYKIKGASITNPILQNSVSMSPSGYDVNVNCGHNDSDSDHITDPTIKAFSLDSEKLSERVTGVTAKPSLPNDDELFEIEANNKLAQIKVRNDKLVVDGDVYLNANEVDKTAPLPNENIISTSLNKSVLKSNDIKIPTEFINKEYITTDSNITYERTYNIGTASVNEISSVMRGKSEAGSKINLPNNVIVHTPVYVDGTLNNGECKNDIQTVANNKQIVLDKDFTVKFNLKGMHRNIKGYGERNYSEFVKDLEIKLPFDAIDNDGTKWEKDKWYSIKSSISNEGKGSLTFKLPVWVDEKEYNITLRVIAENDASLNGTELGRNKANMDGSKKIFSNMPYDYRAYYNIPVEVVGRVFDFKLEYTDDPSFENTINTGFTPKMINNLPFPEKDDNLLNKYYEYAVKLGYKFKFSLKTKGEKSSKIQIIPSFYYVSKKDNSQLQNVDVYYINSKGNKELLNTSGTFGLTTNLTKQGELPYIDTKLITDTRRITGYNGYNNTVGIGTVGKVLLPEQTRLRYDNVESYARYNTYGVEKNEMISYAGSQDNIIRRISNWYGEYRLPSTSTFVLKGGNANDIIKEDGYIIVYFEIKTLDENDNEYLSYQLPSNETQWKKEEWMADRTITLPNGNTVTDRSTSNDNVSVFIYEAKLNNGKDTVGTH